MSNSQVGGVYQAIMDEVLEMSRVDFDENGIDVSILEEMRKGWQERLTSMSIADFPWDPKPEAPAAQQAGAAAGAPPTLAPAGGVPQYTQAQLSPPANSGGLPLPVMPMDGMIKPEPGIKLEPGTMPSPMPGFQHPAGQAQQRAMHALQAKFGAGAAASIGAIKGGMAQPPMPGQHPQQQAPLMPQPGAPLPNGMVQGQQNYARPVQPGMPVPGHPQHSYPGPSNGQIPQVDGSAGDIEGIVEKDGVQLGRIEIDAMLHEKFAARAKQMEGGGLMLPLKEATKQRGPKVQKSTSVGAAQGDAADDEEEEESKPTPDDELINSDLDDSQDEGDDDEDDDMDCVMLCMYDKVQRVKNKWKCTLKDGVLTVSGREYVFHKATGEYEW